MNCRRFEEELEKQGDLKALELDAAIGGHLKNCPACQTKQAEYLQLFAALKADEPLMPEETYWSSFPALVRERIEKAKSRPRWKPVLGWSIPAAALILVAGIALLVSKGKPNLANLTAEEAFNYSAAADSAADIPLSEAAVRAVAAQAEEELVGTQNVEELVYALSDEQLNELGKKLEGFKL